MNTVVKLRKQGDEETIGYIKRLGEENICEILDLHPVIRKDLDDEDLFCFDDYEFYKYHLKRNGVILGCYVEEVLIGYGVMIVPKYDDENLGYDLGLSKDEIPLVAHLDSVAIHPSFRGNKLQLTLFGLLEDIAKQEGYKHLCSTVSPINIYSIKNLESMGLEIKIEKLKYGGKNRFIFYKKIN